MAKLNAENNETKRTKAKKHMETKKKQTIAV